MPLTSVTGVNDRMERASPEAITPTIYPPMTEPQARSTLYRLIEAGQLAGRALQAPLLDRSLEAGDDAVVFLLHAQLGANEEQLAEALGMSRQALEPRLARLIERDMVARRAIGPELAPGL